MSDDLVKLARLAQFDTGADLYGDLSDHIEELEAENKRLRLEVAHANDTADAAIERTKELEAKLSKAVEALDEAVYLLAPDEEDMAKKAGVYRVVTTFKELKGETDE